jgi:predicted nuclease with TOPRIM domain
MMDIRELLQLHRDEVSYQPYDEYVSPSAEKIAHEWEAMKHRIAELEAERENILDIAKRKTERIEELRTNLVAMMMNQMEVTEVINKMQDTFTETLRVFGEIENES